MSRSCNKPKFVELRDSVIRGQKLDFNAPMVNDILTGNGSSGKEFLTMSEEELQRRYEAQRRERDSSDLRRGAAFQTACLSPVSPAFRSLPQSPLYMSEKAVEARYQSAMQGAPGGNQWESGAMFKTPPLARDVDSSMTRELDSQCKHCGRCTDSIRMTWRSLVNSGRSSRRETHCEEEVVGTAL